MHPQSKKKASVDRATGRGRAGQLDCRTRNTLDCELQKGPKYARHLRIPPCRYMSASGSDLFGLDVLSFKCPEYSAHSSKLFGQCRGIIDLARARVKAYLLQSESRPRREGMRGKQTADVRVANLTTDVY